MAGWAAGSNVNIDGTRLEYTCHGPSPAEALSIVLLHEGLGSVALWRDLPERLANATGCGVLAYSRAGYGGSGPAHLPRPLDYMTREAVDVLPKVLDAFSIRKAVLFGHSDGATIAAIHAGSISNLRVRGLILMAPHFFTEPGGLAEIAKARAAFEKGDLRRRMAKYHTDPDATFRGWNDAWLDPDFRAWNVADVLDYIRVPILAIQGRQDPYGTLDQIAEIENRSYAPVDTLILEECGHAPHRDHSETVLAASAEFVARLQRIEAAGVGL